MLGACSNSASSVNVDLPPMPANVRSAGQVTKWPTKVDSNEDLLPLLAQVRKNELRQARAAAAANKHWEELRRLYNGKK